METEAPEAHGLSKRRGEDGRETDGFTAAINCSPGHTQGREDFPQPRGDGGWGGGLPAAQASHLTVTFNTTLPKAGRAAPLGYGNKYAPEVKPRDFVEWKESKNLLATSPSSPPPLHSHASPLFGFSGLQLSPCLRHQTASWPTRLCGRPAGGWERAAATEAGAGLPQGRPGAPREPPGPGSGLRGSYS